MTYNKYPTSFATYEEFEKIYRFIPKEDRMEWAESLAEDILTVTNQKTGWTVAHYLAWRKRLPEKLLTKEILITKIAMDFRTIAHILAEQGLLPEQFQTPDVFAVADISGITVSKMLYDYLKWNSRWDLLTPELLRSPYTSASVFDRVNKDLAKTNSAALEIAVTRMPQKTKTLLLSGADDTVLSEIIRKNLNSETERDVFENTKSPNNDSGQNFPFGERDPLYRERDDLYGAEAER